MMKVIRDVICSNCKKIFKENTKGRGLVYITHDKGKEHTIGEVFFCPVCWKFDCTRVIRHKTVIWGMKVVMEEKVKEQA